MRDPHDTTTLDLVEAARRPLTAAERQRRHRAKKKREREEGRRVGLEFTAEELMLLKSLAGHEAQRCREMHPDSWAHRAHESLWRRLATAAIGHDTLGDARWSDEAMARDAGEVRAALEQLLTVGKTAAGGDGESAGGVRGLSEFDVAFLLWCMDDHLTIRADIHDLTTPGVRELADKLVAGTSFGGFVEKLGANEGVLNIVKRYKDEARRWQRHYEDERKRQRDVPAHAEQRIRALERENSWVVAERAEAHQAVAVLQERLREAGLSDDYRA